MRVSFRYDPGEVPKRKHGWSKPQAGFVRRGKALIGKCPKGFSLSLAQRLLDGGIHDRGPRDPASHPRRIYAVHAGVLYRLVPTEAGKSYHGFPEAPQEFFLLDDALKDGIRSLARRLGQEKELDRWLSRRW